MSAQYAVNNEFISWGFVATFAAIVATGYAGIEWAKRTVRRTDAAWARDLPGLMDDPRRICQQRGHCATKPVPGTDTTLCVTCDAMHTHQYEPAKAYWMCRCGANKRRHTALYRDERRVS